MTRYIAIIEKDLDGYGAFIPDCAGCVAMGKNEEDAVQNVTEALREWMMDRVADGVAPPRARSIEEIRVQELASGSPPEGLVFASVPLLLDDGRLVRANISLAAGFLKTIDHEAKLRGLTRSAFLASAAREKIAAGR